MDEEIALRHLTPDGDAAWAGHQDAVSESIPTCCGIQPGSSWPIRAWILGRCNTFSATRTSSIRFDIANFLPSGSAISGRTRERLADTRWPSLRNLTAPSVTFAERSSAGAARCPTRRRGRYDR